jgi:hypothetical protein
MAGGKCRRLRTKPCKLGNTHTHTTELVYGWRTRPQLGNSAGTSQVRFSLP